MNQEKLLLKIHDATCVRCSRLSAGLKKLKQIYSSYHCAPVPSVGPLDSKLLIVGLAPGLHGANASGRPFTGDYAGVLLFETLYKFGFSNQKRSLAEEDSLKLNNCRIVNAVKCWPPKNKPTLQEIKNCNGFLKSEINLCKPKVILSLGKIAHDAVIRSFSFRLSDFAFKHLQVHKLGSDSMYLVNSYHCSRYNTQTGRLTNIMFESVFDKIQDILG